MLASGVASVSVDSETRQTFVKMLVSNITSHDTHSVFSQLQLLKPNDHVVKIQNPIL